MKVKKAPAFYKFYKGLMMAFDLPESAFMVYMADLNAQRNLGYKTIRPTKEHLGCLGMRRHTFEKCVEKAEWMGLLKRVPIDGMYDYIWDIQAYDRLINIVTSRWSYVQLRKFTDWAFTKTQRSVMSITEEDVAKFFND